ncbi:MAG: hypothetical protein EXR79_15835 [Myxococcales bacterium]|nr:hypothetical protein [Myxococcales bacterium]
MKVRELWSQLDQEAVRAFEVSLRNGDLAGLLLAVEGAPAHASADARAEICRLGTALRSELERTDPPTAFVRVLVEAEGFHGEKTDYYGARNNCLASVLDRRKGQPILLSAVWMLTGEQAGVPIDGIGLPGHFIVRIGGSSGVFADPFGGGKMLSVPDCKGMVDNLSTGTVNWQDEFLATVSIDGLAERVLRNLMNSYQRTSEPESLYRAARFLGALRPTEAEPPLVQARMAEAVGARAVALDTYRSVLDRFPGTPAADVAGERLIDLRDQSFEMN